MAIMKRWRKDVVRLDIQGNPSCRGCGCTDPGWHTAVCPLRWKDWRV